MDAVHNNFKLVKYADDMALVVTFELVPLGRRYRAQGKNIYKHSFIPWAALLFVKLKLRIIFQAYLRCNEYTE